MDYRDLLKDEVLIHTLLGFSEQNSEKVVDVNSQVVPVLGVVDTETNSGTSWSKGHLENDGIIRCLGEMQEKRNARGEVFYTAVDYDPEFFDDGDYIQIGFGSEVLVPKFKQLHKEQEEVIQMFNELGYAQKEILRVAYNRSSTGLFGRDNYKFFEGMVRLCSGKVNKIDCTLEEYASERNFRESEERRQIGTLKAKSPKIYRAAKQMGILGSLYKK